MVLLLNYKITFVCTLIRQEQYGKSKSAGARGKEKEA